MQVDEETRMWQHDHEWTHTVYDMDIYIYIYIWNMIMSHKNGEHWLIISNYGINFGLWVC